MKRRLVVRGEAQARRHPLEGDVVSLSTFVPVRFRQRGQQRVAIAPVGVSGAGEIARREGLTRASVNELLRMARLAPAIIEAAMAGRLARTVSRQGLVRASMPRGWEEQCGGVGMLRCASARLLPARLEPDTQSPPQSG